MIADQGRWVLGEHRQNGKPIMTLRTLLAGRVLVDAQGTLLGPSRISIGTDGRIAAVEPVPAQSLSPEEAGRLIMPALSNAHDHGRGLRTLAFGAPDQSLESWLPDLRRHPRVDPWLNAVVALGRIALSGVAAVNHCHNTQDGRALLAEAEAVSRAARDVGIRVGFGWPFFDRNPQVYGDLGRLAAFYPEEQRAGILASADGMRDCATNFSWFEQAKAFEHDYFTLQYHPVAPQWAKTETLEAIARASAADGRRVHTHMLETELQRDWSRANCPGGVVSWLDSLGLLNEQLTVAHAIWLDDRDIALLAERGVIVSVNLSSNLRLRSGMPQIGRLLDAGVRVAFGLDGMALDDDEDMLRELRLAWHVGARETKWGMGRDPGKILKGVFDWGRQSILGAASTPAHTVAAGQDADLLILRFGVLAADCIMPDPDPVRLVLGRARAEHVECLLIGGRSVVQGGQCTGIDLRALEARLVEEARDAFARSTASERDIAQAKSAIGRYYCCE
ncbi:MULTISPECIES: amidohydrolase family protein [unclassified Sphingobium]|uniref:amidohydrolase family protein n=1 Tax=unclassified Sphingobium TaxID=2611147 RepID=UPI0022252140|nr:MULTISPECIES: amidohydrolase family protein [unclassified Sphingobium]